MCGDFPSTKQGRSFVVVGRLFAALGAKNDEGTAPGVRLGRRRGARRRGDGADARGPPEKARRPRVADVVGGEVEAHGDAPAPFGAEALDGRRGRAPEPGAHAVAPPDRGGRGGAGARARARRRLPRCARVAVPQAQGEGRLDAGAQGRRRGDEHAAQRREEAQGGVGRRVPRLARGEGRPRLARAHRLRRAHGARDHPPRRGAPRRDGGLRLVRRARARAPRRSSSPTSRRPSGSRATPPPSRAPSSACAARWRR